MFTGIINEVGQVIQKTHSELSINVSTIIDRLEIGDSISINGTCLTITTIQESTLKVDLSPETLERTNLGALTPSSLVNVELPLSFGDKVGGHIVQGHVDTTGTISSINTKGEFHIFTILIPENLSKYVVAKGFIALDGISLTVTDYSASSFTVAVIPYTFDNTILKTRLPGDKVNLEVDMIAKYVESAVLWHQNMGM